MSDHVQHTLLSPHTGLQTAVRFPLEKQKLCDKGQKLNGKRVHHSPTTEGLSSPLLMKLRCDRNMSELSLTFKPCTFILSCQQGLFDRETERSTDGLFCLLVCLTSVHQTELQEETITVPEVSWRSVIYLVRHLNRFQAETGLLSPLYKTPVTFDPCQLIHLHRTTFPNANTPCFCWRTTESLECDFGRSLRWSSVTAVIATFIFVANLVPEILWIFLLSDQFNVIYRLRKAAFTWSAWNVLTPQCPKLFFCSAYTSSYV